MTTLFPIECSTAPYEHGRATFAQAAFRWVLSNPHVDALIVSMKSQEQIAEYLVASGAEQVARADVRLLGRYAQRFGPGYCRHGCSACEASCPYQRITPWKACREKSTSRLSPQT